MAKENKRETEFDRLAKDVTGKHSKRMNAILLTMGEKDEDAFANNFFKVLEYVSPKLQRQEVVKDEVEQTITIQHVTITPEEAKKQNELEE
tara:strand:- start:89 stop:361 length:273 start_codon:yes stop_codon:yes gene_type:complete